MEEKKTQKQVIFDLLLAAGDEGITTVDMIRHYIPKYTNRVSELRQDGCDIRAYKIEGKSYCRYVMVNWYQFKPQEAEQVSLPLY